LGRIERSVEIKAPPEKVWEMLALDRMPEWKESCKSAEYTSEARTAEDKFRVGAFAHGITKKQVKINFEITESLQYAKLTYRLRA
jgi:uncharacterized protein YndB with AHSA1/START domain